jgi:hypothetical protein
MELFYLYLLVQILVSCFLVITYSATLFKSLRNVGNKYKFVILLTLMLLISNIFAILVVVADY